MRKSMIIWGAAIALGLAAAAFAGNVEGKEAAVQQEIAGQVVRFHILANSDQVADQELKLRVKEHLIECMNTLLEGADSLEETREILKNHTEYLEQEALKCLREYGSKEVVAVSYETDHFPVKNYGNYTFPAGEYEALRVKIGKARGHNWWCMLYPGLCFQDALHPVLEDEDGKLKHVLSDEAYNTILKKEDVHFTFRWLGLEIGDVTEYHKEDALEN